MDFRPNRADVDPLPFLRDPTAFPPYHMRAFFKLIEPEWDGTKENIPSARSVSFPEWGKLFNILIDMKLIKNGHMRRPDAPKDQSAAAYRDVLEDALTTKLVEKHDANAKELNKQYKREPALNALVLARLRTIGKRLDDYVTQVDESRRERS